VGTFALSAHDGVVFVAGGIHSVTIRLQQLCDTIAGLLDILHHQDARPAALYVTHSRSCASELSSLCSPISGEAFV